MLNARFEDRHPWAGRQATGVCPPAILQQSLLQNSSLQRWCAGDYSRRTAQAGDFSERNDLLYDHDVGLETYCLPAGCRGPRQQRQLVSAGLHVFEGEVKAHIDSSGSPGLGSAFL